LNNIAIIPARGGSKGLPGKNIKLLCGKPLIAYTIEAALNSNSVDGVFVSTEDPGIAAVANNWGAEIIDRPSVLCQDNSSSEEALLHAIEILSQKNKLRPKFITFLQCTAPLMTSKDIDLCFQNLIRENADSTFSAVPFHHFIWKKESQGAVGINHEINQRLPRQSLQPQFLENGAIYIMKTEGFLTAKHRFFGFTIPSLASQNFSLEIDTPEDFQLAETYIQAGLKKKTKGPLPKKIEAIFFDFDGVFTTNQVLVDQDGRESVLCHRGDGMGIELLKKLSIPIFVISKETNPVVEARCKKLKLIVSKGVENKITVLQKLCNENRFNLQNCLYIGNDVNDLECMNSVGCAIAPQDSHPHILNAAHIILKNSGGFGAVRELTDLILEKYGE